MCQALCLLGIFVDYPISLASEACVVGMRHGVYCIPPTPRKMLNTLECKLYWK